ncbi:hypothetical protein A8990_10519 [Paenibacillus taihuensis]|uniref:Uncharacterized protein n=1 Tax=Paenibacillus taihuensis TaxID=1156355 RepID=A0A3D9SGE4_9BACL|nr:hypothetical protein A8990_10519 [Paenibacillus taihuensis]
MRRYKCNNALIFGRISDSAVVGQKLVYICTYSGRKETRQVE